MTVSVEQVERFLDSSDGEKWIEKYVEVFPINQDGCLVLEMMLGRSMVFWIDAEKLVQFGLHTDFLFQGKEDVNTLIKAVERFKRQLEAMQKLQSSCEEFLYITKLGQ